MLNELKKQLLVHSSQWRNPGRLYGYDGPETQRTFPHFHLCSFTTTARVYHSNAKKQEQGVARVSSAEFTCKYKLDSIRGLVSRWTPESNQSSQQLIRLVIMSRKLMSSTHKDRLKETKEAENPSYISKYLSRQSSY